MNQLVLLINLIGLLLIDPLFLTDISITQNLPTTMQPASEFRVTVSVNKSELSGFAKLQLDLPPGLTATAIETKGASFTFADQKAKFIWMALPSTPTFKVTYTLTADASVRGNLAIVGRLSYIQDNERKTFDLPTSTIDFGSGITNTVADGGPVASPPPANVPAPATPVATVTTTTEPTALTWPCTVLPERVLTSRIMSPKLPSCKARAMVLICMLLFSALRVTWSPLQTTHTWVSLIG